MLQCVMSNIPLPVSSYSEDVFLYEQFAIFIIDYKPLEQWNTHHNTDRLITLG